MLPVLSISASGNTQYEVTQASLHWAMAAALDLHREAALPVPLHKGLAPSALPLRISFRLCGFCKILHQRFLQKISRHPIQLFIKISTVSSCTCPYGQIQFYSLCYAKSCDNFNLPQLKKYFYSFQFLLFDTGCLTLSALKIFSLLCGCPCITHLLKILPL